MTHIATHVASPVVTPAVVATTPPLVAPTTAGPATLRRGAVGPDVQKLQELLRKHGYDVATDGKFGPGTEQGVRSFQAMINFVSGTLDLKVDGVVGPKTWAALMKGAEPKPVGVEPVKPAPVQLTPPPLPAQPAPVVPAPVLPSPVQPAPFLKLTLGMTGPEVVELQTLLTAQGFSVGTVDGKFGMKTDAQVRLFQGAKGLMVTASSGARRGRRCASARWRRS